MSSIQGIIKRLESLHKHKSNILKHIRSYSGLIEALNEINFIIGMEHVKVSVVLQVEFLLMKLSTGSTKSIFEDQMLHTVISGPPGTGKTELGKILAKIWNALGILNADSKKDETHSKCKQTLNQTQLGIIRTLRSINTVARDLTILNDKVKRSEIYYSIDQLLDIQKDMIDVIKQNKTSEITIEPLLFKVVSRVDFVAGYVGQTAIKTKKLLEASRGGVLFIDEAYSLINSERDSFGMEALTALNQFMSENPNEIIIIFAGYNDLMNEGIFQRQPGLKSRCSWFIDIEGYSPESLASIFRLQLMKNNWTVNPSVQLTKFFQSHMELFTGYGRDTAKFMFYCKLYHMDAEFNKLSDSKKRKLSEVPNQSINEQTLELALEKYKLNRVDHKVKETPFGFYI